MQSLLRSSQNPCFLPRARLINPTGRGFIFQTPRLSSSLSSTSQDQEQKRDDYYNLILSSSSFKTANPFSSPATAGESNKNKGEHSNQPKVIFGSRLAGPAAREKEGWAQERPPEPDNCCMSGCVNCVWDAYREEVEAWAAKGRTGKSGVIDPLAVQDQREGTTDTEEFDRAKTKEFQRERLFEGLPVGIREFMALEKRLREKEVSEEGKG